MCGIAGIIAADSSFSTQGKHDAVLAMQSALTHRGPDGQGSYFAPSGMASLCHTRLSIIDLSEAGHQPMVYNNRFAITFNGEIYNYQTLRSELEQQGERFSSNSDTEVILKLFAKYGPSCVDRLRGMFAFLIWDEQNKSAFAARDPLGIKPFYYTQNANNSFAFASEVRSLINANLHSNTLSPNGLNSYLLTGTVSEPNTLLEDIKMLPAGHSLQWNADGLRASQYWQLDFTPQSMAEQQAITLTREALESTVKAHFVSDVPVGIFLSGGIDSTALVALASKVTTSQLNTYSIAFESPEWNEGDIAKRVAKHFGTKHTEFLVTPELAKPLFDEFLESVDQPTIDGFNTFCVSKLASQAGEKVVLSGVGGDELFAGYKSFSVIPKMLSRGLWLGPVAKVLKPINRLLMQHLPSKLQRVLDYLEQPKSLSAAHQSLRGIFSSTEATVLANETLLRFNRHKFEKNAFCKSTDSLSQNKIATLTDSDEISRLELTTYMRNQLLRDSDVMSMACGLELRVPFVDQQLIDSVSKVPANYRLQPGKKLLVDAVPEIPDWVVNRPKQGFRFPFDEWFSTEWNEISPHSKAPSWIRLKPWYRRWSLIVLDHWLAQHVEQVYQTEPHIEPTKP